MDMRIPTDIPLRKWIRELIRDGRVGQFYLTEDWKELRQEVLWDYQYECQECLKKGRYTRADCVHHVNEVRHRPDLAMSRTYFDKEGNVQPNLVPLCNTCHNVVHDKLGGWQKKDKFTNEEKW
jgi:5-methylcytosine-specific restriction endonuclease McrA